jgi:hypothetical protein
MFYLRALAKGTGQETRASRGRQPRKNENQEKK